ncbi:MAG: YjzD family protein [Streptococcaceae bacterium]|nr:YjzD family protein [Streptococcaceae bacterium]
MKYITTFFWSLIFGQVIGYIASALSSSKDNYSLMFFISIFFAFAAIIFTKLATPKQVNKTAK